MVAHLHGTYEGGAFTEEAYLNASFMRKEAYHHASVLMKEAYLNALFVRGEA